MMNLSKVLATLSPKRELYSGVFFHLLIIFFRFQAIYNL
jgi:hypothetical protein